MKGKLKSFTVRLLSNRVGSAMLRPLWQGSASIFVLHRLSERVTGPDAITLESIAATLDALRTAGARFVPLSQLFELAARGEEPEPGSVAFTIDDGFADQATMAREGFERNDCPVTIFLITHFIDRGAWPWDDQITYALARTPASHLTLPDGTRAPLHTAEQRRAASRKIQHFCKTVPWSRAAETLAATYEAIEFRPPPQPPPEYAPLTWEQIRGLESEYIEFGPHSLTHRITSRLSDEEAHREIDGSWTRLQQELRRPVPVYAWPTGRREDFGERDMKIAAEIGLRGAVAVDNDYGVFRGTPERSHLFSVRRFPMSAIVADNLQYGTAIERFKQILRPKDSRS